MHQLFDVTHIISVWGYLGIFLIIFFESGLFVLLPGDSLLFTAGLLAPVFGFNVFFLTLLVIVSAFLGGLMGYYIGEKIHFLRRYNFFNKLLKQEYLDEAHNFFEKHGLSSLILCRFMPVVRTFTPIVTGIAKMKYSDFVRYSLLGSVVWSVVFVLSGYYLGRIFPGVEKYLTYIIALVVFISILPGVIHYLRIKRKR